MANRRFLISSCVLLATAIVCHWTYLYHCGRAMRLTALSARVPEQHQAEAWAAVQHHLNVGRYDALAGILAAALGLGLGIAARRRREGRWTLVPFLRLIGYGISLTLVV